MKTNVDTAQQMQCCGGEGCGYVNPTDNIRYCVASRCMGWRWTKTAMAHNRVTNQVRPLPKEPGAVAEIGPDERIVSVLADEGFCGRAGKP